VVSPTHLYESPLVVQVNTIYKLKGQCHEIFAFRFLSWISFPQASEFTNFFRKFAEIFADHHRCQRHRWQMEKIFKQKNFNNLVGAPLGSRVNM
jgi:hypothetical protein